MIDFEIQIKPGLTNEEAEAAERRANMLGAELQRPIGTQFPSITRGRIWFDHDDYIVFVNEESGVRKLKFPRGIVSDKTDPAKPHPEVNAKFKALIKGQLDGLQRESQSRNS